MKALLNALEVGRGCVRADTLLALAALLLTGCNGTGAGYLPAVSPPESQPATSGGGEEPEGCSLEEIEETMTARLSAQPTDADFTYLIERADGRRFEFSRGSSTTDTSYESASTAKWVTATIILTLVDRGYLKLTDRPQDRIAGWPIRPEDPLYSMTLAQLLSFTSGLNDEPACLALAGANFETCAKTAASLNSGRGIIPGRQFYYSASHLQVAGLMAIKARGVASWQEIFSEFQARTSLLAGSRYDIPSATNPQLAGGLRWTGMEYLAFLRAYEKGLILSASLRGQALSDQTINATMAFSPAYEALGEAWHYGFGLWHECRDSEFTCAPGARVSSGGSYGAYPFIDRENGYLGILARQGEAKTFSKGLELERAVRADAEAWAACQPTGHAILSGSIRAEAKEN